MTLIDDVVRISSCQTRQNLNYCSHTEVKVRLYSVSFLNKKHKYRVELVTTVKMIKMF